MSDLSLMLSTAKWAKMQGSTSPLLLMWMYLRPPDRHPPVSGPSPQKSATKSGWVERIRVTPSRS